MPWPTTWRRTTRSPTSSPGDVLRPRKRRHYPRVTAEALLLSGDWRAAQQQLEEAMTIAHRSGELVYQPQLSLLEAAIARARGDVEMAEATLRRAVVEARAQSAP
jgi:ATP/maltotriose-dependent transcriptional regulator MalT